MILGKKMKRGVSSYGPLQAGRRAIVDTDRAAQSWDESSFWDGRNHISKATGDQFTHETLYKSAEGRYYIVHSSQWQGSRDHAEEIPPRDAAAWLLQNDHELPEDLAEYEGDVIE